MWRQFREDLRFSTVNVIGHLPGFISPTHFAAIFRERRDLCINNLNLRLPRGVDQLLDAGNGELLEAAKIPVNLVVNALLCCPAPTPIIP